MPTPADPRWLTSVRVAAIVAALGGGSIAAWIFRGFATVLPEPPLDSGWLGIVLFVCTALMTARAFYLCLETEKPFHWALRCMQYGGINGIVCTVVFFPLAQYEADATWAILICGSPFMFVFGAMFGVAFYAVYFPVLALARRMHEQPSLDLASRMAPWCAGWLTAIALGLALGPAAQHALATVCAIVAAAVASWGFAADRRRRAFLAGMDDERQRFTSEPAESVLPFVGGLGAETRTLVAEVSTDHGPFRSGTHEEALATFSPDLAREENALTFRQMACGVLALADVAVLGTIVVSLL